ncbi:MAG: DUF6445 family protein [Asticcacaulis sp.]|uniref:DUF6445 family protein n=1 Tax=Asticcacaulis sp. TaxID=1872648 RepID=UPI0039E66F0C
MTPELRVIGNNQSRIVIVDGFTGACERIRNLAAGLAPFPPAAGTYYPGLRRFITPADTAAQAYADDLLQSAAPLINDTYSLNGFDILESSFSMVTRGPETLSANQRVPHFDDTDPNYLAILHYLSPTQGRGTAFYRHRATGIERVTAENVDALVTLLRLESPQWPQEGYINGSNAWFEQIGEIEAVPDRLAIYPGSLLHSGIIPSDMPLSADPLMGRLTANLFIKGRPHWSPRRP